MKSVRLFCLPSDFEWVGRRGIERLVCLAHCFGMSLPWPPPFHKKQQPWVTVVWIFVVFTVYCGWITNNGQKIGLRITLTTDKSFWPSYSNVFFAHNFVTVKCTCLHIYIQGVWVSCDKQIFTHSFIQWQCRSATQLKFNKVGGYNYTV